MNRLEKGTLSWDRLIADFTAQANTENSQPHLGALKLETKTNTKSDKETKRDGASSTKPNSTNADVLACEVCGKHKYKGAKHCARCNKHHKGDEFWWRLPENAPGTWKHKSDALRKQAERVASTGSLHQRSGIATPSASTSRPDVNSLFFSTNFPHGRSPAEDFR